MKTLWLALMIAASPPQQLQLELGQTAVINVGSVTDVVIANPDLVDVKLTDHGLLAVSAVAPGSTAIHLIDRDKQQHIVSVTISRPIDHKRDLILAHIEQLYPHLERTEQHQFIVVQGAVTAAEQQHMIALLNDYPEVILQLTESAPVALQMIELSVRIFEVKRSYSQHLGVRWPQTIAGPLVSSDAAQVVSFPVDFSTSLELLVRDGHARLLAEPTLSTYSGGEAEFLVGGEFPIPQVLAEGVQDVSFREYGIVLKIAPQLSHDNMVKTSLSAEISSIDPALAVNGVPGILSRRVSSMVELKLGESLVLSGLLSHEQSVQSDHFPGLHQLPILGRLFSSEQFRNAETELMMMVTPRLSQSRAAQREQQQRAENAVAAYRRQIGCMGFIDSQG